MAEAAQAAAERGQVAMVGFNYRRVPATPLARRMVAEGRLGTLRHVRVTYLQDWLVDPEFPLTWRLRKETAGSGALGDLGAHIVDLAQYLAGEPARGGVRAHRDLRTRSGRCCPEPPAASRRPGGELGAVTVDDAALFTGRFASGALASFEATRFATGRKNSLRIELNGEKGLARLRPGAPQRTLLPRRHRARHARRLPPHPRHRTRPPLPGGLVAAGPRPRLRAHLRPPGPRPGARDRGGRTAACPPSPTGCRCSACWRRSRRAPRRTPSTPPSRAEEGQSMPRNFTLFTGQWADLPLEEVCRLARDFGYDGLELACWGDHFEVDKALADSAYLDSRQGTARQVRPQVLGHLQPPGRPGRLRRHHRRTPPGDPARPVSGATARRRAYGSGRRPRSPTPHGPRPPSASTPSSASPAPRSGTWSRCSRPPPSR